MAVPYPAGGQPPVIEVYPIHDSAYRLASTGAPDWLLVLAIAGVACFVLGYAMRSAVYRWWRS